MPSTISRLQAGIVNRYASDLGLELDASYVCGARLDYSLTRIEEVLAAIRADEAARTDVRTAEVRR